MRFFRLLYACLAISSMTPWLCAREALPGVSDKWKRYESPNFELFSRAEDYESRQLLWNLELLRAFFLERVQQMERIPLPVTIYYFNNERDFLAYVPERMRSAKRTAGYYVAMPDRGIVVLSPSWNEDFSRRLIYHEYIHHLSHIVGDNSPPWFSEGIAELFSTVTEASGELKFGDPVVGHVLELREKKLIPLDQLFATDHSSSLYNESERAGMFYAESWVLLHYWYCGDLKLTPAQLKATQKFFDYIRSEGEKGNSAERRALFEQCLGMTYRQMTDEIERYVVNGGYRWYKTPCPKIAEKSTYRMRSLTRDEVREQLEGLDLSVNRSAASRLALLDLVGKNPKDYRALEILGTDAQIDGYTEAARERWERALAAGSTNPAVAQALAEIEHQAWLARFDLDFRLPNATAERIRGLLHRSIACAPNQWRAYEILAWVEATADTPLALEISLVEQHAKTMADPDRTVLAMAVIRARLKDFATAKQLIGKLRRSPRNHVELLQECDALSAYIARHTDEEGDEAEPNPAGTDESNQSPTSK